MEFPTPSLAYLRMITDCTGVIQHGVHSVPNCKLGYTTDDNARALIVAAKQYDQSKAREDMELAVRYLGFLHYAQNAEFKFKNVMDYERRFLDEEGTEDCYGRTMWACGSAASSTLPENIKIVAKKMFDDSIVWVGDLTSPRARAYAMIGMCDYLSANSDQSGLLDKLDALADSLMVGLNHYGDNEWRWFEPYLTYGNAILPLGLVVAAHATGRKIYADAAKSVLDFFTKTMIIGNRLEVIGNDGWYMRGKTRAWYDQQTIDAGYTVYMYLRAYQAFGDKEYLELAKISNSWFFGNNRAGLWVYDTDTHGAYDAITPAGVNLNQGSESIICYLLAQLAIQEFLEKEA